MATKIAASIRRSGRLLLLGMGGSHAVGRAVEPLYRAHGIDAIALPLSEQLGQPLPLAGRTVLVTSQSGESAEVVRWFAEAGAASDTFGLTLESASFLARTVTCLAPAVPRSCSIQSVYMAVRVRPFPRLPPLEHNGCGPSTLISPA